MNTATGRMGAAEARKRIAMAMAKLSYGKWFTAHTITHIVKPGATDTWSFVHLRKLEENGLVFSLHVRANGANSYKKMHHIFKLTRRGYEKATNMRKELEKVSQS